MTELGELPEDPAGNFPMDDQGIDEDSKLSPRERVELIKDLIEEAEIMPIEAGSIWYLVSTRWMSSWSRWANHANGDDSFGPVDSSDLADENNMHMREDLIAIKGNLREERDYYVIPENAWTLLTTWYGAEGYTFRRVAYEYARGETRIEVHLAKIVFSYLPSESHHIIQISHTNGIDELKEAVKSFLGHKHTDLVIPEKLYFCFTLSDDGAKYSLEGDDGAGKSLEELGLLAPDARLWVNDQPFTDAKAMKSFVEAIELSSLQPGAGLVGLRNLGNTCFMNSALQCLSNCEALRSFFLSGEYVKDINKPNRLGTGGVLVEEFAALLRDMWSSRPFSVVDPLGFKYTLGRFEGRFIGYHQQDSQEFLSALLDRVHEDLNRIKQKPYTETPDRAGRPDLEVAREAWDLHKSRNDSKIVDLFHGQLKSTVTCPKCDNISVTFDPFMFLTLPLPSKKPRSVKVLILTEDVLDKVDISLTKSVKTIGGLKEAILARTQSSPDSHRVVIVEHYNGDIYREFEDDNESLVNIKQPGDDIMAQIIKKDKEYVWMTFNISGTSRKIGYPLLVPCIEHLNPDNEDSNSAMLHRSMSKFSQNPRLDTDQLTIHRRKRESTKSEFPSFHTFIDGSFFESFLADAHTDSDDTERALLGFYTIFLSRHVRLPSPPNSTGREEVGLHECLDLFVQEEKLSPTESWYCSKCKEHQEGAGKKLDLWSLPEILVVHLKRFAYDSYYGHKISTPVAFPINDLDMTKRVLSAEHFEHGLHYELFAISEHYGGLGGGHYTALGKNSIDGGWYQFDDSQVAKASEESVLRARQSAYLLFYRRKSHASDDETTPLTPESMAETTTEAPLIDTEN